MSEPQEWRPVGVDVDVPSAARIYDYALGGAHNFAVDREAADALRAIYPEGLLVARSNRAFLQRAVRFCLARGITQFLDLGSGIPTVGNVHEIAHQLNPDCRVVYVDNEPVAVAHTREIIADVANVAIVDADVRRAEAVLDAPETRRLLDFDQPVAVMMVAVLHYVAPEEDAAGIVRRYASALAPGSYLAISHTTADPRPDVEEMLLKLFAETGTPITHRTRDEVTALFDGLELVEPGVVWTPDWHPDEADPLYGNPPASVTFCGVAQIPSP
ncbi:SAM-dependent methyltransferase [Actinomycetes bacterium KLBMP 9797]